MCRYIFVILLLIFTINQQNAASIDTPCPQIFHTIFDNSAPRGNRPAGNFTEIEGISSIYVCVMKCCKLQNKCNVAFVHNNTCYHVKCVSNDLCLPSKRPNVTTQLKMMLVNPVDDDTWMDALKKSDLKEDYVSDNVQDVDNNNQRNYFDKYDPNDTAYSSYFDELTVPSDSNLIGLKRINNRYYDADKNIGFERFSKDDPYSTDENEMQMDESKLYSEQVRQCNFVDALCPVNEECIRIVQKSRNGVCNCKIDFIRNENGMCFLPSKNELAKAIAAKLIMKEENFNNDIENIMQKTNIPDEPQSIKHLSVSVVSKTLEPPEIETTLSAYTVPDEKSSGDKYNYVWTLISKPNGAVNGTMRDQGKAEVKLSNLSEGLYQFKVTVSGNGSFGEAFANVTVSPKKRINKVPIVVITPTEQTVKLPNSRAILDGSASTDDDQIVSWYWELMQGPIDYQPPVLQDTSTLQLSDLTFPGNYTFKLTVTDSDKAQNSTTAIITVLKGIDYPPEANAGPNVIVYLPHNSVTLNGSLSTDDREIVSWEWTKDSNDQSKAVDMQDTRTPFLKLSNLEQGIYTFVLKVMDASNQTSTSTVRVFVKQPTNSPPVSNPGKNTTINLPQTWVTLNGSESTDTNGISGYYWTQISGPSKSIIANANASIANATSLTVGTYVFELKVFDNNNFNASNRVSITVVQERNTPPVANAGGDMSITLPCSVILIDGSKSNDDLGIANYTWVRESGSLAIGNVIGNSDHEVKLMITNVVTGRYIFRLRVTDAQGLYSSDTASIIVHPDPLIMNLVELTLTMEARVLIQSELESLEQKLTLLLGDNTKLYVRDVKIDVKTKEAVIIFYVERALQDSKQVLLSGQEVETILREKFWRDSGILGASISDIRTTICQNKCSGHGVCNSETRACLCETFWMPDIFYFWGVSEANCDWSILYVIIGVFIGFLFFSGVCWGITCLCRRSYKPRGRSKPQKYALLGTQEDEMSHSKSPFPRSNTLSDSETDSDVLFESRTKPNGILRNTNGDVRNNGHKYSVTRLGRRIKT